jgi:two-component system response regulator MprA
MSAQPPPSVLVVDDQPDIRTLLATALRLEGLDVRLAVNGAEAVAAYLERPAHLVLLDVTMPILDGPEALTLLLALDPAVRCCFMTGYAEDWSDAQLLDLGALNVLPKPFRLDEMVATVRRLLGARPAAPAHATAPGY